MIASTVAIPAVRRPVDEAAAISAFAASASFETTHPSAADFDGLAARWASGTAVYVSAVPARPPAEQIAAAIRLHQLGFTVVPHLAARSFATADELDRWLVRMSEEAQVNTVLVIGGDREAPAGLFHHAVEAIDSGLLQARGITAIGIAGYPDGHARISQTELERALLDKIEAAEQTGLAVHIVTQFAFTAAPIVAWIRRLRDDGFEHPVRVGLAGPASLASLARFARICGVKSSVQGLARNAGLVKHVFGTAAPDELLRALAREAGHLGEVTPHFYSFGGLAATARWVAAVAAGRITLDRDEGFSVAPP
jgi:methylenetetrahydrofolate reductase (NADPH)